MGLEVIRELNLQHWDPRQAIEPTSPQELTLESGKVLYFPMLPFELKPQESRFLSEHWSDGKTKNISYRGEDAPLQGAQGTADDLLELKAMMARFSHQARQLIEGLFPAYQQGLKEGFTSFRPARVEGRKTSWRKDDTRLHVDSFPSNPTGGKRLLRVFSNLNPAGLPRVWRIGEPFLPHAQRFFPEAKAPIPGKAWLMEQIRLTKSRRTDYDHYMGQLHDLGKKDLVYQETSPQQRFEFPPGTTWVVFSDQVLHAAIGGQFMLEQTFKLPPEHLVNPAAGPLAILEALAGRPLIS